MNCSLNPNESSNLSDFQKCVKFKRIHFLRLGYSSEYSGYVWFGVFFFSIIVVISEGRDKIHISKIRIQIGHS